MQLWHLTSDAPRSPHRVSPGEPVTLQLGAWPIQPGESVRVRYRVEPRDGANDEGHVEAAWDVLYKAQRIHQIATTGPYAYLRHPQYIGFVAIMLGFLIQWPTLITLVMFPILATMYIRLARREEREALAGFGDAYAQYAARTAAFFPRRPQALAGGAV